MNAYINLTMSCEAGGSKVANQANHEPYPGDWYIWLGAVVCKGGVSSGWGGGGRGVRKFEKKNNFFAFQLIGSDA
jgi:hypothetical protein